MGEKAKKSRMQVVRENWDGFVKFLYNREEGTVLGRNGSSWWKILVFYFFYYGFLACLFAASVSIVLSTLDDYTPKYQTRLQTPGIAIQPKIPSHIDQTSDISFNWKTKGENYDRLVTQIDNFLSAYDAANQTDKKGFKNCSVDSPPNINQQYTGAETELSCRFDKESLGDCAKKPYGYDTGRPCIYIKINRIIDWFPVGFTDLSAASGYSESGAPDLAGVLETYNQQYKPYLIYTACYGDEDDDKKNLNGGGMDRGKLAENVVYSPMDMGIPFAYYPYKGSKRQPSYLNPLVAVQFKNVTKNVKIEVSCKVYALNIKDSKEMGEGFFKFELEVKE